MADGTKTALDLATAATEAAGEDWDAVEPELDLGLPEPATAAGRALVAERRGRGRPPGSRNRRTTQRVEQLLSTYQDPRAVLLAIAQTPVDVLALSLGCSAKEALQEVRLAAIGVLPYVAQRQPISVDVTNTKVVHLTIIEGEVAEAAPGDELSIAAELVEVLQIEPETDEG